MSMGYNGCTTPEKLTIKREDFMTDKPDNQILTSQQIALLTYIRQGIPPEQAIRMSGMDFDEGLEFLSTDDRGTQAVGFSQTLHKTEMNITRDLLTSQMYEERARSISATEGMACLNGIAKLNGLFDNKVLVVEAGKEGEDSVAKKSLKAIQRKTDDELIAELDRDGITIDLLPTKINRNKDVEDV